jgi:hypothetical protein
LTDAPDDGIVVVRSGAKRKGEVRMDVLTVPAPVRDKLGDAGSDGLVMMFAEAHRLATDSFQRSLWEGEARFQRSLGEAEARFERRLLEETAKLRLDMADLKFDLLKWSFLFWVGQLAVLVLVLSWMLRGVR